MDIGGERRAILVLKEYRPSPRDRAQRGPPPIDQARDPWSYIPESAQPHRPWSPVRFGVDRGDRLNIDEREKGPTTEKENT